MTRRPPFPPPAAGLAPSAEERLRGAPVVSPSVTVAGIGAAAARAVLAPAGRARRLALPVLLAVVVAWIFVAGMFLGGREAPFAAAGFGWWAGLASGCLTISALVLLARVDWRCGIGRLAQTAALAACAVAALHPAPGDGIALLGLAACAFGLWAAALVPDLAALRDRPELRRIPWRTRFTRRAAMGWHGEARQWLAWERACRAMALGGILAAFALQTDLALTLAAGSDRHDTLLPVALVVGAVLSASGLIATLAALLRREPGFDGFVTGRHLDILGRLILALGLAGLYCHVTEAVVAGLYGSAPERALLAERLAGAGAPAFWTLMLVGLLPTQALWVGAARRSPVTLGLVGALAALGAGAGHVLIAPAQPVAGWADALPGLLAALAGPVALFGLGLLAAFRLVPAVSVSEMRGLALLHNRRPMALPAALPSETGGPPPRAGLAAAFASEPGLVEALRGLGPSESLHLDAHGPAPMPESAAALHRDERAVRETALVGAALASVGFLGAHAVGLAVQNPDGLAGVPVLAWARLAIPALSAAATGAALGAGAALAWHLRRAASEPGPPPDWREVFVLTVRPALRPGENAPSPGALARRLSALPEKAGRPLALRRAGPDRGEAP
jgi:hypothetical protein